MSSSDKEGDHHGSDIGPRHAMQQRRRAMQQQQQGFPLGSLEYGHQGRGAAIRKVLQANAMSRVSLHASLGCKMAFDCTTCRQCSAMQTSEVAAKTFRHQRLYFEPWMASLAWTGRTTNSAIEVSGSQRH